MKFYLLRDPDDYTSERDQRCRNGWGGPTVGMPGVDCSVCGQVGGLFTRVLPWRLPPELESELKELDRRPIPEDKHRALQQRVQKALLEIDPDASPMPPGASFRPLFWNFKDPPHDGCFWGIGTLAVSAVIGKALQEIGATGFDLIPVDHVRVGVPTPRSLKGWRKSEDGLQGTPGPEIFYVSINAKPHPHSRMRELPPCPGCGRTKIELGFRWERWEDLIWNGDDIFYYPGGGHRVVTERVATILSELAGDTVRLTPLQDGREAFRPYYLNFANVLERLIPWLAWRNHGR